jgi:DNA-binding GntR family transcriptional regulator
MEKKENDIVQDFKFLREISDRPLGEIIYGYVKKKIMRGDISHGQKLSESALVKTLGVSRTPIRYALDRLDQEKFIRKLTYGGYEIKQLTRKDIEEIFGIRGVLESYAASLATKRMTKRMLKKLQQILLTSRNALGNQDPEEFIELNTKFHDTLYKAGGSEQLYVMIQNLHDYLCGYRKLILSRETNRKDSLRDHETMIEAMSMGDGDSVERLVRQHVARALNVLLIEMEKLS